MALPHFRRPWTQSETVGHDYTSIPSQVEFDFALSIPDLLDRYSRGISIPDVKNFDTEYDLPPDFDDIPDLRSQDYSGLNSVVDDRKPEAEVTAAKQGDKIINEESGSGSDSV